MDIKDLLNEETVGAFAEAVHAAYGAFDHETFLTRVFDAGWPARALKQRIRHITVALHDLLSAGLSGRARYPAEGQAGCG